MKKIKGSCLCKSISFEIINECRYSILCHCTMCQKSNAEFSNYTKVQKNNFKFLSKKGLKWFLSSKKFKRGFCNNCGSSLFFQSRQFNHEKSNLSFSNKHKKFMKSANGFFDNLIYKIK